jgi:hypothetical protein
MKTFLMWVGLIVLLVIDLLFLVADPGSWFTGTAILVVGLYCAKLLNEQHHKRKELEERRHEQVLEAIRESGRAP